MTRAFAGLLCLLIAPALSAAVQPAVETTVELRSAERAAVRTRIAAGSPLAGRSGFHGLTGDPEQGWRRTAMVSEPDSGGDLVFAGEVVAGPDGWLRAPIPIPDTPPPPGTDLSFAAEVRPPPGYRVAGLFPAGTVTASGAVQIALPASPSLLRFRVTPEDDRTIGLAGLVDGAVALLFVGLAGFGIRRLLRPATPSGDRP